MTQNPSTTIRRRHVLSFGASAALVTATASGCSFFSTDPGGGSGGAGSGTDTKESPMLTERVDAGDLPPLEERLPAEPLVVEAEAPGIHGGTLNTVTVGPGDSASADRLKGYEPGLRKSPDLEEVGPGVFTGVEQNEDGTVYTITLRKGMKWSDGEPLTADDIVFAVKDVLGNEELNPSAPNWISSDGKLATAEKVDEVTVTVTFPAPTGLFMDELNRNMELTNYPFHYAKDFHPDHSEDLDARLEEAGLEIWTDLWNDRVSLEAFWTNPELPTIDAWNVVTPLGEGNKVTFERNPYYWKTDADGRQLPYLDGLSLEVVSDPEVIALKTSDGEIDILYRHANTASNKPVFADALETAQAQILENRPSSMNSMCVALNLAHKDEKKRTLYQNKDFRIGLSHAINREELITSIWQRQGEPWQWAPHKDSDFYDEEFAKQYTEYDVAKANEHLDKAGVTGKDGDGFRTMPDGSALAITLDVPVAASQDWPNAAAVISDMWKEVGIRASVNSIDRTLFYERKIAAANEHDAGIWGGDGGLAVESIDPRWYMPFSDESVWATPWAAYFNSEGKSGEEPIGPAKEQIELMWEMQGTPEPEKRDELFRQILAIAKEEFWGIGIVTTPTPYMIVKNRLKNVIGGVPDTYVYRTPGHTDPETWFISEDA